MDVKAINSTQSALNMHSSNVEAERKVLLSQEKEQKKEEDLFNGLSQQAKNDIILQTAKKLNEKMEMLQTSLKVEIDKDTGIQVVKIVDEKTKEVIRQLPPETMLKIAKYIDEITGLLFDKKA